MNITLLYLGRKGAGPVYTIELVKALLEKGCHLLVVVSSYADNIEDWRNLQKEYDFNFNEIKTYRSKKEFLLRICFEMNKLYISFC